jgi:site-specific DNA recombinase
MQETIKEKEKYGKRMSELQDIKKTAEFNEVNVEMIIQSLSNINDRVWDIMDVDSKRRIIKSAVDKILWDGNKIDLMLFGSKKLEFSEVKLPVPTIL